MEITIIGAGYVGLVASACFAHFKHQVTCIDIDETKIKQLQKGIVPIFEPRLSDLVKVGLEKQRLHFTAQFRPQFLDKSFIIITVGTPMHQNGAADLNYLMQSIKAVEKYSGGDTCILIKSTVPVGTTQCVKDIMQKMIAKKNKKMLIEVGYNPEFLQSGSAVENFLNPERIIVGLLTKKKIELIKRLYEPWIKRDIPLLFMDAISAELTKYAANTFLATKISFMNEMARLSEKVGGNIQQIHKGITTDSRIGKYFLEAGIGYGGSCLPKDLASLLHTSKSQKVRLSILEATQKANRLQKKFFFQKIQDFFQSNLKHKTITLWGLTFKAYTNDMRESPTLDLIDELLKEEVKIRVYDPLKTCIDTAQKKYKTKIEYAGSLKESLIKANALVIMTKYTGFKKISFDELKAYMKEPVVFDARNYLNAEKALAAKCIYHGVGIGKTLKL